MARHRLLPRRASLVVLLLLVGLLLSSSLAVARALATPTALESRRWSRKLLVTAPRVSPDTLSSGSSQQEMDVGGWWRTTPFRRAWASLGRRVPGSHANPSHN